MDEPTGHGGNQTAQRLTASNQIHIVHHPVPEPLGPFITTLYHFTCEERRLADVIPAGVGYVMALLRGSADLTFAGGDTVRAPGLALLTPTSGAAQVVADGPLHLVGAALSPLGWAALTRLAAHDYRNRVLAAAPFLGDDEAWLLGAWRDAHAVQGDGAAQCAALAAAIGSCLVMPPARHVALLRETGAWLSTSLTPSIEDLGQASGYSSRQVERLVKRYFGSSPRDLARKYRALRVAALLQSPDCTDEQAAGLIDLFYDQSHLIREMRHFLGRTPSRLAGEESALTQAINGLDNFRKRQPSFARLPEA